MKSPKNLATITITVLMLSALAIRLVALDATSIRADEGTTIFLASLPFSDYLQSAHGDVHPPGYYRHLRLFWLIGTDPFTLRLASVLAGVLCVPAIYLLGKRMFDESTGLIAATIMTISEFQLRYSQTLRMYSVITLLAILCTLAFWIWRSAKKPTLRHSAAYILTATAMVYTHYFSALIILFQGIFLIICQREKLRSWIIHGAIVTALFLPWLPTFI
ncbi:MAG: glycosyltransferase family 39 protein, partial [Nanoarchaeota archaeon]